MIILCRKICPYCGEIIEINFKKFIQSMTITNTSQSAAPRVRCPVCFEFGETAHFGWAGIPLFLMLILSMPLIKISAVLYIFAMVTGILALLGMFLFSFPLVRLDEYNMKGQIIFLIVFFLIFFILLSIQKG
jgi:hypothetical protein